MKEERTTRRREVEKGKSQEDVLTRLEEGSGPSGIQPRKMRTKHRFEAIGYSEQRNRSR